VRRGGPMIYENPSDEVLRESNHIRLIDPRVPWWKREVVEMSVIVDFGPEVEITAELLSEAEDSIREFNAVEIPVDSTNEEEIARWEERIHAALK